MLNMERIEISLGGVGEEEVEKLKEFLNDGCWTWTTRQIN